MRQIEPQPSTTITHENTRLKVIISNDFNQCFYSINKIDCKHIKCSKNDRKDGNNIILIEDEK